MAAVPDTPHQRCERKRRRDVARQALSRRNESLFRISRSAAAILGLRLSLRLILVFHWIHTTSFLVKPLLARPGKVVHNKSLSFPPFFKGEEKSASLFASLPSSWRAPATGWQHELKRCSSTVILCRPEPAAVSLDYRAADRQSHSHPLRLGRIKGLEQTVQILGIQSRTRISYNYHHTLGVICAGAD